MQFSTRQFKKFFGPLDALDDIFQLISVTCNDILLELLYQPPLALLQFEDFDQSECGHWILIVKLASTLSHNQHELLGQVDKDLFVYLSLVQHPFE